jgi:hypothetical protein
MVEQYLSVSQSRDFPPACVYETPVWRYLLYKTQPEVFDDVKADPAVPSQPFAAKGVVIDGEEYTPRDLAGARANPRSWAQDGGVLYVHYSGGLPAWLFFSHTYGLAIGRSTGKTRFFDGRKYSAGLDIKLKYRIEADSLEYAKMKLSGGDYAVPARGEFDSLAGILGNDVETSYSLDGAARVPLDAMFVKEAETALASVTIRAADKREKLNVPVAAEVFTEAEYPKMKETYYGKNKQEAFGCCRGVPAVCLDARDVYTDPAASVYKTFRTFRAASVIASVAKIEVKMTQPEEGQNEGGDVWVTVPASSPNIKKIDYAKGEIEIYAAQCLPLLSNGQPDYGNEPYEVRVTGTFRTDGTHWEILKDLLETAMGNTWESQCDTAEMQAELAGTGTVGLFVEKETKIFEIIEALQPSGVYGWQLHSWRGRLAIRRDDNARAPLPGAGIRGADILNIDEAGVSLSMDDYATTVEVEYQRNYSEDSNNALRDDSNRRALFPVYRNDKTYTAQSRLEYESEARARADYLLAHFASPRPFIRGIRLFGERWLGLRIYDIIGVYLEQDLRKEQVPGMLTVLSNELRRQEAALSWNARKVYYVLDRQEPEKRRFGGNIYIKIMRIEQDISSLVTEIDGLYIGNIGEGA